MTLNRETKPESLIAASDATEPQFGIHWMVWPGLAVALTIAIGETLRSNCVSMLGLNADSETARLCGSLVIGGAACLSWIAIRRGDSGAANAGQGGSARYRTIVEEQSELVCCYDPNGRIVYANPAYCRLIGISQSAIVGMSFLPPIAETNSATRRNSLALIDSPGENQTIEQALILPQGQVMWVQWTQKAVRNRAGRVVECQVVGRDITRRRQLDEALQAARDELEQRVKDRTRDLLEANGLLRQEILERKRVEQALRESEFLFRQLAENIEEVFWIISPSQPGSIYLSPAFEKVWGRSLSTSSSRGQSLFLETIHPEDRGLMEQAIYRQCLGLKTDIEYRILRPDGSIRWIWDRAFPVRGMNGHLERIAGLAQDVTLRKQSDEHERIHLEELAHVSRLSTMGEMASGLAHEINQPLAAIHNYCMGSVRRLQAKAGIELELIKALESAASEAQRAGEIIKRLRSFVKKRPSERTTIAPIDLIHDVIQLAEPEILANRTRLTLNVSTDLPLIDVDVIQIEQVLLNLIRNALEAMRGVATEQRALKVLALSPFDEAVEFAVVDSGPGLEPSVLRQLFQPFFTTKPEGMGLGLAISRSIIEAHGGTLWGVSPSGGGARFNFRLAAQTEGALAANSLTQADADPSKLTTELDRTAVSESDAEPEMKSPINLDANFTTDSNPSAPHQREVRADDDPNSVRD